MPDNIERRWLSDVKVEARAEGDGSEKPHIVGYAAVYEKPSDPRLGFTEVIKRGAFTKVLATKPNVIAQVNHDPNRLLGRTKNGTLVLAEDDRGLIADITPPKTQAALDAIESIQRGDMDGMSFSFRATDSWAIDDKGHETRTIEEVTMLLDVGPVTMPAYPDTSVALRALEEWHAAQTPEDARGRELQKQKLRLAESV